MIYRESLQLASMLALALPLFSGGAEEGGTRKGRRGPSLGEEMYSSTRDQHQQQHQHQPYKPEPVKLDERNNLGKAHLPPGFLSPSVQQYLELGKSVPGRPGTDYPVLGTVPYTDFYCDEQEYPGFFADMDTRCQVWHYCDIDGRQASFLCPNGTQFSQAFFVCDWWFNVRCSLSKQLYAINARLYGTPKLNPTRPHRLLTKQILENIFLSR